MSYIALRFFGSIFAPLIKTGGQRQLGNLAVNVAATEMAAYKDAWHLIRQAGVSDA
jgi:hypothetical protein